MKEGRRRWNQRSSEERRRSLDEEERKDKKENNVPPETKKYFKRYRNIYQGREIHRTEKKFTFRVNIMNEHVDGEISIKREGEKNIYQERGRKNKR